MKTDHSLSDVNDAIAANEFLSKLRPSSKHKLAHSALLHCFGKSETVYHQAANAERFWLVRKGAVKLVQYGTQGAVLLLDLVLPNQFFGAVFYPENPVYPSDAETVNGVESWSFRRRDLLDDLRNNSLLQRAFLADICSKLCESQRMRGLFLELAPVRVATVLLNLHARFGRIIPQTRETVAAMAGTTVETAMRTTGQMARVGIVTTKRGQIRVVSLGSLKAWSRGQITGT